jgi:hypothetical protein
MRKWNLVAMGQTGLTGSTAKVAKPIAKVISERTGWSEAQVLALIGGAFLAITLVDFLRTVDAVVTAGRTSVPAPIGAPPP